jgi:3-oxoacyl-[acyl-carrier-protein] synthase II
MFGTTLLEHIVSYQGNRLQVIEPAYKDLLDAKLIRRMSRIIRMGTTAAIQCLKEAHIGQPGAIITGTAYGCLEDTGTFLTKMVAQQEDMLPPTPFIQSTHNTVGAQIALMLKCHAYNNTFVHNGFSFESALQDAVLLLKESETDTVLVGSADELTDISYKILSRMGLYKKNVVDSLDLFNSKTNGTIGGEGTAFFLLSGIAGENAVALEGMDTFYMPGSVQQFEGRIHSFLDQCHVGLNEIDIVIAGRNGDEQQDQLYNSLQQTIFNTLPVINYKHLCGDYPTASSFALWLAYHVVKAGNVPLSLQRPQMGARRLLICNTYLDTYCSLMLVAKDNYSC